MHYEKCKQLYGMCDNNLNWKINITKFYGTYAIFNGFSDFFYIPDYFIQNFINLLKKMYESRVFLECAVPTSFAIISGPKYQLVEINAYYGQDRDHILNFLYKDYKQISIHPIKFSNIELQIGVNKYISFINSINY